MTQRKLCFRVRKIREQCPELRHVVIAEPGDLELETGEVHFDLSAAEPVEHYDVYPAEEESPSLLHYRNNFV